jgi:hypothetical protein
MADPVIPLMEPIASEEPEVIVPPKAVGIEDGPFTEKTDNLVAKTLETLRIQGLAISVINGDKIYSKVRSSYYLHAGLAD